MKLITAFIQPEKLTDVKQALYEKEIFKMSVSNALGCGQQRGFTETYRGVDIEVNLLKKVRIDIAVNDEFVEPDPHSYPTGEEALETENVDKEQNHETKIRPNDG